MVGARCDGTFGCVNRGFWMEETYKNSGDVQFLGVQGGILWSGASELYDAEFSYKGCLAIISIFEVTFNLESNRSQILKADWSIFFLQSLAKSASTPH